MDNNDWRMPKFRQIIVAKIEEAMRQPPTMPNETSSEIESQCFNKAKNKEEYLGCIARLILHLRDITDPRPTQLNMQATSVDPMNALRVMNQPGTHGQMMNIPQQSGPPHQINPASDLLQLPNQNLNSPNEVAAMQVDDSWRTPNFRETITAKLAEAMQQSSAPFIKSSAQIERFVFKKAKNKEQYMGLAATFILHIRDTCKIRAARRRMMMRATSADPVNAIRTMMPQPGNSNAEPMNMDMQTTAADPMVELQEMMAQLDTTEQMTDMHQGGPSQQMNPASDYRTDIS